MTILYDLEKLCRIARDCLKLAKVSAGHQQELRFHYGKANQSEIPLKAMCVSIRNGGKSRH